MKKYNEYLEPEFKVVIASTDDVITTSGVEDPENPGNLATVSSAWEMGTFTI